MAPPILSTKALTSYERALNYVGLKDVEDDATADLVGLLVNGFSEAIYAYCDREFHSAGPDPVTRFFDLGKKGWVDLAPFDLRELQSLTVGGADFDLDQLNAIRLFPRNKTTEDTQLYLRLYGWQANFNPGWPDVVGAVWPSAGWAGPAPQEVAVTGLWGIEAVPYSIEMACLVAVKNAWTASAGFSSARRGGTEFTSIVETEAESGGFSLPPSARRLASPFRRSNWGK